MTATAFGGGKTTERDVQVGLARIAGAVFVAAMCTIPILLIGNSEEAQVTTVGPALTIGVAGFFPARAVHRRKTQSPILAGVAMVLGPLVAAVKSFLMGH